LIEWGIVDPFEDTVEEISGLEYFLPVNEQRENKFETSQTVDDFIFSTDGKSIIVLSGDHEELQPGISRTIFNQKLTYYSFEDGSSKTFENKPLDICVNKNLDGLVSWSSDNRYLLGYCWASFSDARTFLLFDTSNQTYIDLRNIPGTDKSISAALSNNGQKIALFDYSDGITVYEISNTGNFTHVCDLSVQFPMKVYWSKDDLSIFFDNQRSIQQHEFNSLNSSEKTLLDIDDLKFPEQNSQKFYLNDWYLSSDSSYILLFDKEYELWVYD
jgi:hypothetical protein